ncbi:uncharacterized [Tachysurus ichikawai]
MNGSLTPMVAVCFYPATDLRDYFWLCVGELSLNCKAVILLLLRSFSILSAATQATGLGETFLEKDLRDLTTAWQKGWQDTG